MPIPTAWKGQLRFSGLVCSVALYSAIDKKRSPTRIRVNRATGNRVKCRNVTSKSTIIGKHREYFDVVTGEILDRDDCTIVVRYDDGTQEDATSGKAIIIESFDRRAKVDDLLLGQPYYLVPQDTPDSLINFELIRQFMQDNDLVCLGHVKLRIGRRTLMLQPRRNGILAIALRHKCELRPEIDYFARIPNVIVSAGELNIPVPTLESDVPPLSGPAVTETIRPSNRPLIGAEHHHR
jgi:DNA end-binding protein Ku